VTLSEEVSDEDMVEFEADRRSLRHYYITHGIPVYPTLERAVKPLRMLSGIRRGSIGRRRVSSV